MKRRRSTSGMTVLVLTGSLLVQITFAAPSGVSVPSAWQITDNSAAGGSTLSYTTNLTAALSIAATNLTGGFCYTVNARFAEDFSSATESMTMNYSLGRKRFLVWWDLDSNSNLTARLEDGITYTLTANGLGTAMYHTHEIIYNPTNGTASYVVDGNVITNNWPGGAGSFTAGRVSWGAGSSTGKGQMNFNRVTFAITNNIVASYDADFSSLNPTTAGWTENLGSSTTASNVPGDLGVMLAVATTTLGNFTNSSPVVKAQAYAPDAPMLGWFEWGTDTNYGNVTPVQDVGFKVGFRSFNATLTDLLGGPDYHYRAVVSNIVGVVKGEDNTFNVRFIRNYNLPDYSVGDVESSSISRFTSVADYDNDGWLDLLLTGKSAFLANGYSILFRNMGDGTFSNVTSVVTPGLPQIYGTTAWGDFDNDGRLDLLLAGKDGTNVVTQLWRNTSSGFTNVPIPGVPVLGDNGITRIAWRDYDNDGRLDFLIAGWPDVGQRQTRLLRNTGNGFTEIPVAGLQGLDHGAVAWGDYDNDGLADILTVGRTTNSPSFNEPELWRNTGDGFTGVQLPGLPTLGVSAYPAVAFGDYDGDGRLDLLFSGVSNTTGTVFSQLLRNTSGGFTNVPVPGLPAVGEGMIAWGDYNNNGQLDFVIAGATNLSDLDTPLLPPQPWENTGGGFTRSETLLNHPDDVPGGAVGFFKGSLVLADFNHDGRLDILLSGKSDLYGSAVYYGPRLFLNNLAVGSNQPPTAPAGLSATIAGGRVNLSWNAPSDDHTLPNGLSYNVRIGTTPGGRDIVSPPALPDGRLTQPQIGPIQNGVPAFFDLSPGRTYYWSVQAVDGGLAGSPFATEQQFSTPPLLIEPVMLGSGQFQFSFTNLGVATYEVLGTTNVALPLNQWSVLGLPTSLGGSLYQFTDTLAPNHAQRFYLLRKQ